MVGMSNFTLDPAILGVVGGSSSSRRHEIERKALMDELLTVVKECQKKYGGKTELATEEDSRIILLCDTWERVLSHGLKSTSSVLKNVTDLVAGGSVEMPVVWDFAFKHLTNHEKERFAALRHVWTNCGKGKALLRAILNERALERYMLIWLGDEKILEESYECWALMRDGEITGLLPNMAAGLSTILFAVSIDAPELNAPTRAKPEMVEPIIATQPPAGPARKVNVVQREILDEVPTKPILNLSSSPNTLQIAPRTANIDIIREYTDVGPSQSSRPGAYSVEDALNSLSIAQEIKRESKTAGAIGASSPDNALEASEDSIIGNYSSDTSTATTTTATNSSSGTISGSDLSVAQESLDESFVAERNAEMVTKLKRQLVDSEERCQMLESRVAELSLENHRLRMHTRSNRLSLMHFQISIPKAVLRTPVSGRRREHYCYEIRISPNGTANDTPAGGGATESWSVFRRYSEFYRLHKRLQKEYSSVRSLDFPPKKKIGNMNAQFVEQRRQRLQVYLNSLFITTLPEVSACNTRSQLERAFPFLHDATL
ncbi:sorting nexin-29-like [Armigeres subalbatus]|uniref:sorting nexin-29-like n=1 Tax=Armigeres subalbatus TaxID=124917 RepID=UPI002ED57390